HKNYVILALSTGLILPAIIAATWGDALGGLLYGYHNYHHEFPKDYRNGYRLFDYDPSKWVIWFFHCCTNQVPSVARVPDNEIRKARSNMKLLEAQREREQCDWG
ncbi:12266_t:CDS:2, partial [Cetraspora pellucida]